MYHIPIVFKMALSFLDEHRFGLNSTVNTLTRKVSFQIKYPGHIEISIKKRNGYSSACGNGCLANFFSTIHVDLSKTSSKMVGWFTIRDGLNENICSGRFNILHWRLLPCSVHIWCIVCQRHRNASISVIKRPLCLVSNYQFNYQGRLLQLFLPKMLKVFDI